MNYPNIIQFEISGRYALFTDPLTSCGGDKCSLPAPTYEALKGMARAIYSSAEFSWVIDAVRIIASINATETMSLTRRNYFEKGQDIAIYTYLRNVRCKVLAHMEFPEGTPPETQHKHYSIARRMLRKGGRREVYLGTKSCPAEVSPCHFHKDEGYYDDISEDFGLMYHSITYKDGEAHSVQLFHCRMERGIIAFPRPEECPISRRIKSHALV